MIKSTRPCFSKLANAGESIKRGVERSEPPGIQTGITTERAKRAIATKVWVNSCLAAVAHVHGLSVFALIVPGVPLHAGFMLPPASRFLLRMKFGMFGAF